MAAEVVERLEVDDILDAVVVEGAEVLSTNPLDQIAAEDEVLAAQRQQIRAVHPLRRRRQAQHELGGEVVDDLAVASRRRVMELIDDDVVEGTWREGYIVTPRLAGREGARGGAA